MYRMVLIPADGANKAIIVPLRDGQYVVGRGAVCDIVIKETSVSRKHARLTLNGERLSLTDLGSRNGTFVDERRVYACPVGVGQTIRFGEAPYQLALEKSTSIAPQCDEDETGRSRVPAPVSDCDVLTPSQRRVYNLLLEGATEADIAAQLNLSVNTVHSHVKAIYSQFAVHSRAELLAQRLKAKRLA